MLTFLIAIEDNGKYIVRNCYTKFCENMQSTFILLTEYI